MSIKLWGSVTSACTHRVLITLNELGLKYNLTQVNLMRGEQRDPAYIEEQHPFGRIPVIHDGDLQLFKFRAICRYLVTKYGGPSSSLDAVVSDDPVKIGKFEKALSIDCSKFLLRPVRQDIVQREAMEEESSLADVYVFTWMPYIKLLGLYEEVAGRPNVEDLWKRVSSRSAWKSAVKDMPQ
ncbi:hypothetical protein CaCOL14_005095 [Colletotrichum acutatum]